MKIAILGLAYPFRGGIAHYTASLAGVLKKKHDVRIFSLAKQYPDLLFPGRTQYDESEHPYRHPAESVLEPLNPVSWKRTADRIISYGADCIIMQHWNPFFAPCYAAVGFLAGRRNIPCAAEMHNVLPHEPTSLDRILLRPLLRITRGFMVHSKADASLLSTLARSSRIITGFHPRYDHFGPMSASGDRLEAREKLGIEPDKKLVLYFGLVRAYKGLADLIAALPLVPVDDGFRVIIAGEFYEDEKLYQRKIAESGLQHLVRVENAYIPDEDVAAYFRASDVVVLPYRSATQSGIVQIASALKRPVIVTSVGGLPEVVDHGRTGLVVPPNDPDAIAGAIRDFFEKDMGPGMEQNLRNDGNTFTWDELARLWEKLLEEIVNG